MIDPKAHSTDADAIRRFAAVVFDGLPGFVCCRLLGEKGGPDLRPRAAFLNNDLQLATALLGRSEAAEHVGAGCFVVPGTVVRAGHARAADVTATAVVLVDLDAGDVSAKRAHLAAHLGEPTLEVASGGLTDAGQRKLHLYWRLSEPAAGEALKKAVALPSFARAHQPIRVAGSIHGKHGRPNLVEIVAEREARFDLGALAARIQAMPEMIEGDDHELARPGQVRAGGLDGKTRFDAMSSFIGSRLHEVRVGRLTQSEAWQATLEYNRDVLDPPWCEEPLRTEFTALKRVDQANHDGTGLVPGDSPSEDALAQMLAAEHGGRWKHAAAGGWLQWTGTHWAAASLKGVIELARDCCRRAAAVASTQSRPRLLSNRTIQAVARLASSDERMLADAIAWDARPMLLNTPGGVVDLTTGEITPNCPAAAMTRIAAALPGGAAPHWDAFLATFTQGDPELAGYLGRVAGYCMTGDTTEQAFFFLHGAGANGKSVFMAALCEALGSYAITAPLDAFMAARGDRHPTDLAGLRGARLVSVTETEPGRAWAESRIKAVTGGDPLSVRLMHRDFFEFVPTFKLVIAGNHRPRLTSCGEAMRRRLHLIPCRATIPPAARDRGLLTKLRGERGGILAWALAGCADWRRQGLALPQAVRDAAADYFAEEDFTAHWIAERCSIGPRKRAASQALYASWKDWAQRRGLVVGSSRELAERLKERGFTPVRDARTRGWSGLSLRDDVEAAPAEDPT